jgi:hypothetical protein
VLRRFLAFVRAVHVLTSDIVRAHRKRDDQPKTYESIDVYNSELVWV